MEKIIFMATLMSIQVLDAQTFDVYFGTYTNNKLSEGIYHATLNVKTGKLSAPALAVKTANPSFLAIHPNKKFLYSVTEGNPGMVSSFYINSETNKLKLINQALSGGKGPCHVMVSKDGKTLLSANYSSGSLASTPINTDGSLGKPVCIIQHEGKGINIERQEGPHVHSINLSPDNRFAYVADLGIDKVMIYQLDSRTCKLNKNEPGCFQTRLGAGPRHFTFHPNKKIAYLINELDNTILTLAFNPENGELTETQSISTLPEGFNEYSKTAEIKVHPNGKFLYGSNRGHDSIVIYKLAPENCKLTLVGFQNGGIKNPRHFNVDPSGKYCIVANQDLNNILLFEIDQETGLLNPTSTKITIGQPVCIKFLSE